MAAVEEYSGLGELEKVGSWEGIVANKTTEDLVELGRIAQEGSIKFYFVQCLIASVVAKRRDGGLKVLSGEWGVAYTRASEMGRVWREIVKPMIDKGLHPPIELEQEYFHVALRCPEPVEAISYAQDQKNKNSGFTCAKFRSAMRTGLPENLRTCGKCQHCFGLDDAKYIIRIGNQETEIEGALLLCSTYGVLRPLGNWDLQEKASSCSNFTEKGQILGLTSKEPCSMTKTSPEGTSM